MASFDGDKLHYNKPLSTIIATYRNNDFIADAVSPIALVDSKSDDYFKLPEENELRDIGDLQIGPLGAVAEVEAEVTTDTYKCIGRSLLGRVANEHEENKDIPLSLRAITARTIRSRHDLRREIRVADQVGNAANYPAGNVLTVTDKWDDPTKNPLIAVRTYAQAIYPAPDTERVFWMGEQVFTALTLNPFIMELIKYGGSNEDPALANMNAIARLVGVSKVVVGRAYKITSNPASNITKVRTRVWGKKAGIVAVPRYPSTESIGHSLTFRWNHSRSVNGISMFQGFDDKPGSLGEHWQKLTIFDSEKVVANEAGVLFDAAVA